MKHYPTDIILSNTEEWVYPDYANVIVESSVWADIYEPLTEEELNSLNPSEIILLRR